MKKDLCTRQDRFLHMFLDSLWSPAGDFDESRDQLWEYRNILKLSIRMQGAC